MSLPHQQYVGHVLDTSCTSTGIKAGSKNMSRYALHVAKVMHLLPHASAFLPLIFLPYLGVGEGATVCCGVLPPALPTCRQQQMKVSEVTSVRGLLGIGGNWVTNTQLTVCRLAMKTKEGLESANVIDIR